MEYLDSHDLNFSNRLVRTRMPGGVAGARLTAAPYADQKDHLSLAKEVRKMPHRWMMTYDDVPEISSMYEGLRQYRKTLTYYAQVKRSAAELLILSDSLVPPPSLLAAQKKAA